jgi:hypothetical protein
MHVHLIGVLGSEAFLGSGVMSGASLLCNTHHETDIYHVREATGRDWAGSQI